MFKKNKNLIFWPYRAVKTRLKEATQLQLIRDGVALFLVIALVALIASRSGTLEDIPFDTTREVMVSNVALLSTQYDPLSITGNVRSTSQANLRAESQGEIVGVYRSVGDFIFAGTVIAEIKNNAERAAVLSAEGAVEQAEAQLKKLEGGTREEQLAILELTRDGAAQSFNNTKISTVSSLLSVYATINDAILQKADQMFSNPRTNNPNFSVVTSDSQLQNTLELKRLEINVIIERQKDKQNTLSEDDDLSKEIDTVRDEIRFVSSFLDDLNIALNKALPTPSITLSTIALYKIDASSARVSVNSSLSAVTAARNTLNNSETLLKVAEKNLEQGVTGERSEDIAVAQASLKQAQGALRSTLANLSKKLIRTPINGTINTLNVDRGDFIGAFELVAVISNNNTLEIQAFITETEKDQIKVGSSALISGRYAGVVTSVSPGLDPITKKIEIRVALAGDASTLTHGGSVRVLIDRNGFDINPEEIETITIPIKALKVETDRIIVFTVSRDRTLVPHEIEVGLLLGDNIIITEGLSADMDIVIDARGLRAGDRVIVK